MMQYQTRVSFEGYLYEENGIQVEAKDGLEEMGFV
jgi:hypothetical protein